MWITLAIAVAALATGLLLGRTFRFGIVLLALPPAAGIGWYMGPPLLPGWAGALGAAALIQVGYVLGVLLLRSEAPPRPKRATGVQPAPLDRTKEPI